MKYTMDKILFCVYLTIFGCGVYLSQYVLTQFCTNKNLHTRSGGGEGGGERERDFARNFHFVLSTWSKRSFAYRLSICLRFETSKIGSGFGKVLHDTSFRLSFCPSLCLV